MTTGGWEPTLFTLEQHSYIILGNRLIAQYESIHSVPFAIRCYLMRKLAFIHEIASTRDCWDDWPLGHECIDPLLKKIVIPEAKFIFSLRQPETWLRSMANHYETTEALSDRAFRSYWTHQYALWLQRMACLKTEFPQDVLFYDISKGWRPLCEFFGLKIPRRKFPKENVRFSKTAKSRICPVS